MMIRHKITQFIAAASAVCALNTGCAHQNNSYETPLSSVPAETPISRIELPPEQAQALAQRLGQFRNPDDHFPLVTIRQASGFYDVDVRGGCDMTRLTINESFFGRKSVILDEFVCQGSSPSKAPTATVTTIDSYPDGKWTLRQDALGADEAPVPPDSNAHKIRVINVVSTILKMTQPAP